MKRSQMVDIIRQFLHGNSNDLFHLDEAEDLLDIIEDVGMRPPPVKSKQLKPNDYKFGSACSMRCECPDYDPNYLIYVWEDE